MKCPYCCEEFDINEAREEFEAECYSPNISGYDGFWYDQTPACGRCSIMQFNILMERHDAKDYQGRIPSGCEACGGDYPICRNGCAMFDD